MGYYYDMGNKVGYDITVGRLKFTNVSYHSKFLLIDQLVRDKSKREDIEEERFVVRTAYTHKSEIIG